MCRLAFMRRATMDFVDNVSKKISASIFTVEVIKQRNFLWRKRPSWAQAVSLLKFLGYTHFDAVRILWTSDQLAVMAATYTKKTQGTNIHKCPQRDLNTLSKQQAATDLCLRRYGYWDRLNREYVCLYNQKTFSLYFQNMLKEMLYGKAHF
jgi:hypothetical protein